MVQDFQFYVTDLRYSVPTLLFVEANDADAARVIAERLLIEREHYHVIEVWEGGARLFTVGVAHRLRPRRARVPVRRPPRRSSRRETPVAPTPAQ